MWAVFACSADGRDLLAGLSMNLGHNSNVQAGGRAYHVQTEDRGSGHPFIDTSVYSGGRVVHRRTTSYADLLQREGDRQSLLQKRVEDQHRAIIDEIRAGTLQLSSSSETPEHSPVKPEPSAPAVQAMGKISVTLLNAGSWMQAGSATLAIDVRDAQTSRPKAGALVSVTLEGALSPTQFEAVANSDGHANVDFPMPKLGSEGGTLVIRASSGSATDEVRYHLKSKRTPVTPPPI